MKFDTNFDADPNEDDPARRAKVTEYAKAQGGFYIEENAYYGNGWWWLRSPGNRSNGAADVSYDGRVYRNGRFVGFADSVVRPALWVEVE